MATKKGKVPPAFLAKMKGKNGNSDADGKKAAPTPKKTKKK